MNSFSLGSPVIDALALDYLGFSFLPVVINNIWTWVAVITAAVSFWRIRAVGPDTSSPPPTVSVPPPPHTEEAVMEGPVSTLASSTRTSSSSAVVDVDTITEAEAEAGPRRGKFTVYYEDESEGEVAWDGGVEEGGVGEEVGRGGGDYWCDNWEKAMRMRIEGDINMGYWYRYQDLTVLDGNVVRLWDGCRDKSSRSSSIFHY